MKTIYQLLIVSALFIGSTTFASAQYYYGNNYQNQYQYQNYSYNNTYSTGGCTYTTGNPAVYYGNCIGIAPINSYQNNYYTGHQYTYTYPYQNYYPTNNYHSYYNTNSQYQTYGYTNGSWYPGYSTNNISNLVNGVIQAVSQGSNCYYQGGYQVCY